MHIWNSSPLDVAAQYPEVVQQLSKQHFDWYETVIPHMINLNNTWEKELAPLEARFYKQEAEKGIPEWIPNDI